MRAQIATAVTEYGIALTPLKYKRTERFVGTAILKDVNIADGKASGELVGEYLEPYPLDRDSLPGPVVKRMRPLTEGVTRAKILYAGAGEFFYLP